MKLKLFSLVLLLSIIASSDLFSATPIRFDGNSEMILFSQNEQPSFDQLSSIMKENGLPENYSLHLLSSEKDLIGITHNRYQEFYLGNPIHGTMWMVNILNEKIQSMNGVLVKNISTVASQNISSANAYSIAYNFLLKENNIEGQPINTESNASQLFWAAHQNELNNFQLCYRFDIYFREIPIRKFVYVSATSGEVVQTQMRIHHTNATGTAVTGYSGSQTITTDYTGASYRLRETGRGLGVETYNLNHSTNVGSAVDFTDADNTWNNVNANEDQYATDAHWGTEKTYDYYWITYGRNSVDNAGFKLKSYVHYSTNYYNAFWDGTAMTYGDGDATVTPLTTLDIAGHEISHGVTENSSNLNYSYESGALNEGFSDCMGTAIEFYGKPGTANWLLGSEIGETFRSMSNPNLYGQPDTYLGTNWYAGAADNGGVHTNSGVLNYWFYLLCQGGSGTNDNGNAFSVTSITMTKAAAILYRANTVYYSPTTNYASARTGAIQAAIDLYGACSNEVTQVTNAWYAVGVGAAYVNTPVTANFTASGTTACTVPYTVVFSNTSTGGGTYLWNFGDGGTSTSSNPSHTYTSFGNYTVSLTNNGGTCGIDTKTNTNYINLQASTSPSALNVSQCGGGVYNLTASGNGILNWFDVPTGGTAIGTGTSYNTPSLSSTTTYYVESNTTPSPVYGGIPNNTVGGGGYYSNSTDRYLIFNCASPVTLVSVVVYAQGAGNRTIQLRNSSNTVLQSLIANLADGQNTVTLNFAVPIGTGLILGIGGTSNLWRNNAGAVYPYAVGSSVSITNSNSGTAGYYYYFYNWKVQEPGCISNRTAVQAIVTPNPTSVITAGGPTTFCTGSNVVLTNSSTGFSYQWKKGATNIAGATNISYTVTATGSYTCVATNSCGTATSNAISVTKNALPAATVTLTGANPFCKNTTVTLTANSGASLTYQWYKGAVAIAGATNISLPVSVAGNYKVQVTKTTTGCSKVSATIALSTVICRLENGDSDSKYSVYPNPFTQLVTIQFEGNKPDRVELIDVTGRILEMKNVSGLNDIQLGDMLPSGFYIARLYRGNEVVQNIKLVKTE